MATTKLALTVSPLTDKREVLARLTHKFVDEQYNCWNALRPALAEHGIRVLGMHELDAESRRFVDEYCEKGTGPAANAGYGRSRASFSPGNQ